jgi:hypothetical protein
MPTAADMAALRADQQRRAAEDAAKAAEDAAWVQRMRGRHVQVLGHDGRFLYVKITRPTWGRGRASVLKHFSRYSGSHVYKLDMLHPTTALFVFQQYAVRNGLNMKNRFYWGI